MRLNDVSPAEWDRVTKDYKETTIKTGLEKWQRLAEEEAKELDQ